MDKKKTYICIDLKSFYASVECVERGLDALKTNLVVADLERTEKTICLAVSPSLKAYGIPGRARLFEVVQRVKEANAIRKNSAPKYKFTGESYNDDELKANPELEITYITAKPRMAHYIEYSTQIYNVYLKYVAPEDIHVYSIDEVFVDLTNYLKTYKLTGRELTEKIINDVFETTGITATAGIGTNMYLAKVAMDIVAKHAEPNKHGVRIAELDEISYRRILWSHRPLTDFWRVGRGYRKKLEAAGLYTMGDVARCSIGKPGDYYNEDLLYKMFGINAELLIDHAWGYEPCTMEDIKNYKPESNSLGSGQVLHSSYSFDRARLVAREMAEQLALDLVEKELVASGVFLYVGYDRSSLVNTKYSGEVTSDWYGRSIPKHAQGGAGLPVVTSSAKIIVDTIADIFDKVVDKNLLVRRVSITALNVVDEQTADEVERYVQLDFLTDYEKVKEEQERLKKEIAKEKSIQKAVLDIKKQFGKNAVIKGMDLQEGATAIDRNNQIGGHNA